jgi:hypothetical protein
MRHGFRGAAALYAAVGIMLTGCTTAPTVESSRIEIDPAPSPSLRIVEGPAPMKLASGEITDSGAIIQPRRKRIGPPKNHPGPRRIENYTPQEALSSVSDTFGDGPDFGFEAVPGTGWVPPDADLAVGQHHIVAIVNGQIAIFDKQGNNLFRQNLAGAMGFWAELGAAGFVFDPEAHYDEYADRYWVVACEQNGSAGIYNLAVSSSGDPTQPWHKYRLDVTSRAGRDIDSPNLSIGPGAIYLTADFSEGGDRMLFSLYPKAPFLTGGPIPAGSHLLMPGLRAAGLPGRLGPSAAQFMVQAHLTPALHSTVVLHGVRPGPGGLERTSINIQVPPYLQPGFPPQPQTGVTPDLYDARFWSSVYRRGSIWATHNIRTATSGERTVVRWYEFRMGNWPLVGTPHLAQWGEIDLGSDIHTFCPSLAVDRSGNMALSFARSSEHEYISFWRAVRRGSDPAGVMRDIVPVRNSSSAFTLFQRWGDYGSTVVDPASPCTFWGHHQFTTTTSDWRTWIARYEMRPEADLDGNCRVDIMDFVTLQQWFAAGDPRGDLDQNGRLDSNDFMLFITRVMHDR